MPSTNGGSLATNNGLDARTCRDLMGRLATLAHDRVEAVVRDSTHVAGVDEMGPELSRTVRASCEAMLRNLDRDGRTVDTSLCALIDSGRCPRR